MSDAGHGQRAKHLVVGQGRDGADERSHLRTESTGGDEHHALDEVSGNW